MRLSSTTPERATTIPKDISELMQAYNIFKSGRNKNMATSMTPGDQLIEQKRKLAEVKEEKEGVTLGNVEEVAESPRMHTEHKNESPVKGGGTERPSFFQTSVEFSPPAVQLAVQSAKAVQRPSKRVIVKSEERSRRKEERVRMPDQANERGPLMSPKTKKEAVEHIHMFILEAKKQHTEELITDSAAVE